MTREEAITNIVMIRSVFLDHLTQEQKEIIDNTFDMAIEALSAESCEDCISRAEVMKLSQHKPEYGDMIYAFDVSILPSVHPISKSVIEDIKADIAEFMAKIPALGNCKEGWHNAGQRIGLEQACEIIDNHIPERGDNES